jgi:hypothetical protein
MITARIPVNPGGPRYIANKPACSWSGKSAESSFLKGRRARDSSSRRIPCWNVFTIYCSAGPRGGDGSNITAQIVFAPEQAERIAHDILQQLAGFAERVADMEAKGYGELRINGGK